MPYQFSVQIHIGPVPIPDAESLRDGLGPGLIAVPAGEREGFYEAFEATMRDQLHADVTSFDGRFGFPTGTPKPTDGDGKMFYLTFVTGEKDVMDLNMETEWIEWAHTFDDQAPLTSPKTVEFFSLRLYAVEAKWQIPDDGWSGDRIRS